MKKVGIFSLNGNVPGLKFAIKNLQNILFESNIKWIGFYPRGIKLCSKTFESTIDVSIFLKSIEPIDLYQNYNTLEIKHSEIEIAIIFGSQPQSELISYFDSMGIFYIQVPFSRLNDSFTSDYCVGSDSYQNEAIRLIDKISDTGLSHHKITFIEFQDAFLGRTSSIISDAANIDLTIAQEKDITNDIFLILSHPFLMQIIILINKKYITTKELLNRFQSNLTDYRSVDMSFLYYESIEPSVVDRVKALQVCHEIARLMKEEIYNQIINFKNGDLTIRAFKN